MPQTKEQIIEAVRWSETMWPIRSGFLNAIPLELILAGKIEDFNPHVVLAFSEAGTTAPWNPDHSWSGIATLVAADYLFKQGKARSLRQLITYTLPRVEGYLEDWAEMVLPGQEPIAVDVVDFLKIKKRASAVLATQRHLIEFFDRVGILDLRRECFYDRLATNQKASCKSTTDDFQSIVDHRFALAREAVSEEV